MVHYGHSNQLRQARAMGDYLIVGVHTDGKRSLGCAPLRAPRAVTRTAVTAAALTPRVPGSGGCRRAVGRCRCALC